MAEAAHRGRYFSIHLDAGGVEFVQAGDEGLVVPLTAEGQVILGLEPSAAFWGTDANPTWRRDRIA